MKQKDGIFQRKPGGPYYAIVVYEGIRYRESTGSTTKTEAKAYLDDMRASLRRGTYKSPTERRSETAHATTVSGLADKWLAVCVAAKRNEKGIALAKARVERYLKPAIGDIPVANVTKDTLREYRVHLQGLKTKVKGEDGKEIEERILTDQTVAHILSDVRALFVWAHDTGRIAYFPVPKKLLPKIAEREPKRFSADEERIVCSLDGPMGFAHRIMVGSGVRWGELCRLTRADLVDGELVIQGETKTKKLRRVPIGAALQAEIRGHVGKLVPYEAKQEPTFIRSARRASGVEKYGTHRCRHTFALRYINELHGDLLALQKLLGHAALSTTERYLRSGQELVRADCRRVMGWSAGVEGDEQ